MLARDGSGRHRSLRISYYAGGDHWGLTSGFEPHPRRRRVVPRRAPLGGEPREVPELPHDPVHLGARPERPGGGRPGDRLRAVPRAGGPSPPGRRPRLPGPGDRRGPRSRPPPSGWNSASNATAPTGSSPPRTRASSASRRPTSPTAVASPRAAVGSIASPVTTPIATSRPTPPITKPGASPAMARAGASPRRAASAGLRVEAVPASRCPVNAKADCIGCHMPKVEQVMPFTAFTDHHIRIHKKDGRGRGAWARRRGQGVESTTGRTIMRGFPHERSYGQRRSGPVGVAVRGRRRLMLCAAGLLVLAGSVASSPSGPPGTPRRSHPRRERR